MHQRAVGIGIAGDIHWQVADLQSGWVEQGGAALIKREARCLQAKFIHIGAAAQSSEQQFDFRLALPRAHLYTCSSPLHLGFSIQPQGHFPSKALASALCHHGVDNTADMGR